MGDHRSKEDGVLNISTSIFVTNFPDQTNAKELWSLCNQYGNVIDAFIPNRRSKVGKRFGFIRFIKTSDVERLVNNLCTIWIGKHKLHANIARFNRPPLNKGGYPSNVKANTKSAPVVNSNRNGASGPHNSYIQAAKAGTYSHSEVKVSKPALVLDESCLHEHDLALSLVGKLKEFGSLPNLNKILMEEGFTDINIRYMGGFWVLLQFSSKISKENFMSHVGVNSWFSKIEQASNSFYVDERVAWIEIKGVPLRAWSHNTFSIISSTWGTLLYDEDEGAPHFHRKRLCIKTTIQDIIFYSIKIIVKWKVFWIRVKELTGWTPNFKDMHDEESDSDVESVDSKIHNFQKDELSEIKSEKEEIPETVFDEPKYAEFKSSTSDEIHKEAHKDDISEDPFNIYAILNKEKPATSVVQHTEGEPQYPPGFTPCDRSKVNSNLEKCPLGGVNQAKGSPRKENDSMASHKESVNASGCSGSFQKGCTPKSGGSMLQVIEDLIKETKIKQVDIFNIKACWGNLSFNSIVSPSVGSLGGILCVWDSNMFLKENSTVSDYFIAIRGTWLPNNKNMLIISVYAPQELAEKKMLWNYLNLVINRWKGDVIVIGDFNEVHSEDKRYGSIFNALGAAAFNSFISARGFESFMADAWCNISITESNAMFRMALKLKILKGLIRGWVKGKKDKALVLKKELKNKLSDIDSSIDKGKTSSTILEERMAIMSNLSSLEKMEPIELAQKAKVKWSIEGDENSKFFHGIINKHLNNLAIRGIVVDGVWIEDPIVVKNEFLSHFQNMFNAPREDRFVLDMDFPNRLSLDQAQDLEKVFSKEEIKGGNSSFIALIPKTQGAKMVKDVRLITLIGSLYKIITKLLANRLVTVIDGLVNVKKKQTMIFKVNFEKAFVSVRWDFLDDVLKNFVFGSRWREWIQSCLKSSRGSILVNGSLTSEFQFFKGLKQGDPLSPFLFILVMESLHLSFQNVVDAGLFKGVALNDSLQISHLFYADDVVFIGQWCESNIATIIRVLDCFYRASGLHINLHKSKLLGLAVENDLVNLAANSIGCMTLSLPFSYLGVNIGGHMSRISSWDVVIDKVLKRLSKWKMKVLSVGVDPNVRNTSFIKWDNVLASKENGVLGVSSFFALNRALIFKWVWRFRSQSNSLWSRVIKVLHGKDGKLDQPFKSSFTSNWVDIIRSIPSLCNKGIDLLGFMKERGGIEQVQMDVLSTILEDLILPNIKERWSWSLSGDGEFSVPSARSFIDAKILETVGSKTQWCKYVPIKINILS
ncbi:RNA-directed DNA polymerase, eukaryota [Tanacetum coccineum]